MKLQVTGSNARFQAMAKIIEAVRRHAGAPYLPADDIRDEAMDWSEICSEIPDDRIRDVYVEALRGRETKALLQPGELNSAWKRLRDAERSKREYQDHREAASDVCYYCDGCGWQTVAYIAESGNENTAVRACYCSAAPPAMRKSEPYREPEWRKRKHSVIWEKVT